MMRDEEIVINLKKRYPLQTWASNPLLRKKCDPIKKLTPALKEFAEILLALMRAHEGVWLAAPQIGELRRMAAISQWDLTSKPWQLKHELVIINPEIVWQGSDQIIDEEACLSLPGEMGKVARSATVTIKYLWVDGKDHFLKAQWYNARIILHEMDHLDGVLFVDKLAK
jgi:peptide deformylase